MTAIDLTAIAQTIDYRNRLDTDRVTVQETTRYLFSHAHGRNGERFALAIDAAPVVVDRLGRMAYIDTATGEMLDAWNARIHIDCPICGKFLIGKAVRGAAELNYVAAEQRACDSRCEVGRGPDCTCRCGGENHGAGLR